jgi:hypothetical protein
MSPPLNVHAEVKNQQMMRTHPAYYSKYFENRARQKAMALSNAENNPMAKHLIEVADVELILHVVEYGGVEAHLKYVAASLRDIHEQIERAEEGLPPKPIYQALWDRWMSVPTKVIFRDILRFVAGAGWRGTVLYYLALRGWWWLYLPLAIWWARIIVFLRNFI